MCRGIRLDGLPDPGGDIEALLGKDVDTVRAAHDPGRTQHPREVQVLGGAQLDPDPHPLPVDVGDLNAESSATAYAPSMRT